MKPIASFPEERLRAVRGVFTDIDDTITNDGRLTARAYGAMERLQNAGVAVVPITGRPAGWCDHIARMWPVDGVVGENGAFYFRYDRANRRMDRRYVDPDDVRDEKRWRLKELGEQIVRAVPGAAISADQLYRETDLAVDFCEDVPPLSAESIDAIVALLTEAGATAKVSSIHVNGWFGNYDKLTMTKLFATDCLGVDLDAFEAEFVFTGDSPNDGPMFDFFSNSVGVANVREFEDRLASPPPYVTKGFGGDGFAEVAEMMVAARSGGGA